MTRRPIIPIAEKGVYTKPWKKSFWEAVDDNVFIALTVIFSYPISIAYRLFKKDK